MWSKCVGKTTEEATVFIAVLLLSTRQHAIKIRQLDAAGCSDEINATCWRQVSICRISRRVKCNFRTPSGTTALQIMSFLTLLYVASLPGKFHCMLTSHFLRKIASLIYFMMTRNLCQVV